jgi:hypothetical protein
MLPSLEEQTSYWLPSLNELCPCPNCMKKNLPESISCAHCHLLIDHVALNEIMNEQEEKGKDEKQLLKIDLEMVDYLARRINEPEYTCKDRQSGHTNKK